MLRKLSFILIFAIFLSACGASAPMDEMKESPSAESALDNYEKTETFPGGLTDTESVAAEIPDASEAEYFYFSKYSNTVTGDDDVTMLYENRCTPSFTSADPARSEWVGDILGNIERDYNADSTNLGQYAAEFIEMNGTDYFYSYSNYQQLGIARHDEAVVSLLSLSSLYSGGSHPNSVQMAYNLDIWTELGWEPPE